MALTTTERRFLREWEIQRSGSKLGYYALYMAMWTIICMLSLFFILNYLGFLKNSWYLFMAMLAVSLLLAFINTHVIWLKNEKKFKALINREVNFET